MCMCVYVCIYIYIYTCIHTYIYSRYMFIWIHVYIYMFICGLELAHGGVEQGDASQALLPPLLVDIIIEYLGTYIS